MNKTKIVCTFGPSSASREIIKKMYDAGMSGLRINTAYGTIDQYKETIETLRAIGEIPIILDIKGPEIRLKAKRRTISEGETLEVGFGNEETSFNWDFYDKMKKGDIIAIDNGQIKTRVIDKINKKLQLEVVRGGEIADGKGVNVPNKTLSVPTLSEKDKELVQLAKELEIEYIALSFTRNARDIINVKSEAGGFKGALIAKIENPEGIDSFEEILECSDAIMVARGDMGVELGSEKVPLIQKAIIKSCNQKGKPVITATEMLESMMQQPFPTRAEVSDVANAILDGTDATMLSGETAVGKYPVESVAMISRIASETERAIHSNVQEEGFSNESDTISKAVQRICDAMPITKVVTLTRSGYTAKMIARFRIQQPIIAVTPNESVKRELELVYGVSPIRFEYQKQRHRLIAVGDKLYSLKLITDEDTVLFTAAFRTHAKHASNLIVIHKIRELRNYRQNL